MRSRIRDACSFHVDIIPFILFHYSPFEQSFLILFMFLHLYKKHFFIIFIILTYKITLYKFYFSL